MFEEFPHLTDFKYYFVSFTLRIHHRFTPHFYHGGAIHGFLKTFLISDNLFDLIHIHPQDTGVPSFGSGEFFRFSLAVAGDQTSYPFIRELMLQGQDPGYFKETDILGGNYELIEIRDLAVGKALDEGEMPTVLDAGFLAAESEKLGQYKKFTLHFVNPLRITRQKPEKHHSFFDEHHFDIDRFFKLLGRRIKVLCEELYDAKLHIPFAEPPELEVVQNQLFWMDAPNPRFKSGGAIGRVTIAGDLRLWLPALILGQFFGVGQMLGYGMGHYRILGASIFDIERFWHPDWISRILDTENLQGAYDYIKSKSKARYDEISISRLAEQVRSGEYAPSSLQGLVLKSDGKKPRFLAIPNMSDRTLQRAVVQVVGSAIDKLLQDSSYGYRRYYSRHGAARRLDELREQGYSYVLDADIQSFFDNVDLELLLLRFHAYFPDDDLLELVRGWLFAPVWFNDRLFNRSLGVPQGAPISPIMANLFLDKFDEKVQALGFQLVRYADDFLILAKRKEHIEQAKMLAEEYLEELRLKLHPEKTEITDFERGFHYLGYLFLRSLKLDVGARKHEDTYPTEDEIEELVTRSWQCMLADPQREWRPLDKYMTEHRYRDKRKKRLFLDGDGFYLKTKGGLLEVRQGHELLDAMEYKRVGEIHIIGKTGFAGATLKRCLAEKIPVFFYGDDSGYLGTLQAKHNLDLVASSNLFRMLSYADEARAIELTRAIVQAKLHNSQVTLRRQRNPLLSDNIDNIKSLIKRTKNATSIETLRGLEGEGAAVYFKAISKIIPREFGFTHRQMHPSPDPVNAMLSFGYTMLCNQVAAMLLAQGIPVQAGIMHTSPRNPVALASDMMEEFRFLVDQVVLRIVHLGQVKPENFLIDDEKHACYLDDTAKRALIVAFQEKLDSEVKLSPQDEPLKYREIMYDQIDSFSDFIRTGQRSYAPFRIY